MKECVVCNQAITYDDWVEIRAKKIFICDECLDAITRQRICHYEIEYRETSKMMRGLSPQGDIYAKKALDDSKLLTKVLKLF